MMTDQMAAGLLGAAGFNRNQIPRFGMGAGLAAWRAGAVPGAVDWSDNAPTHDTALPRLSLGGEDR